jgi:hypothetical protein
MAPPQGEKAATGQLWPGAAVRGEESGQLTSGEGRGDFRRTSGVSAG